MQSGLSLLHLFDEHKKLKIMCLTESVKHDWIQDMWIIQPF